MSIVIETYFFIFTLTSYY